MDMRELLKQLMALHNDDAYKLAEKSGVPQPTTQRFVSGKHGDPRSPTVKKWASAYGITESQMRGDQPLPSKLLKALEDFDAKNGSVEAIPMAHQVPLQQQTKQRLKIIECPDLYTIPQYQDGGSMGHGLELPDQPGIIENWSVSREWLNKNVRNFTATGNLCIVTGFGPSMQPLFNPGDPLLVDIGIKSVVADGIYFFRVGSEGFVKQLQKIPTAAGVKYIAKSKNPDYDTFEISDGMDFEVLGRVIRVWCGTDF